MGVSRHLAACFALTLATCRGAEHAPADGSEVIADAAVLAAPTDAPADAPTDAPTDTAADAGADAPTDAAIDAGLDAPTDADIAFTSPRFDEEFGVA